VVSSYIHATGRVGVLVEVGCETDFVARNDEFREFAREVAVHIAGASPRPLYVSKEEIPDSAREAEREVLERRAREDGKSDEIVDKIVGGQLAKWEGEVALLEQEHINTDRHEGKTIEELRAEIAARTGENVTIARFARFQVGEE
jgi:elongation factor Ts